MLGVPDAVEAAVRADRLGDVAARLDLYQDWVRSFPNDARVALLARAARRRRRRRRPHYGQAIELGDALSPFDRARTELLYGE